MTPLLVAVAIAVVGAVAWRWRRRSAGRTPRPAAIDPFTLGEPWRRHVAAAQSAERRYGELVRGVADGPLRERLDSIGRQVGHAVEECFAVARRGDELDDALSRLDVGSLERQLERAADDTARVSLRSQLAAAGRLRGARDDTDARLRLLVTRMGELTALAAEVSVGVGADGTEMLGTGVDDVVVQLEGLRLALQELGPTPRPSTSP